MKVELTSDAVDGLMRSVLIQDYKGLLADNERLRYTKEPRAFQLEDLAHNLEYQAAFEKLLEYYVGFHWRETLENDI